MSVLFISLFATVFSCLMTFAEPAPTQSRLVLFYEFNGTVLEQHGVMDPITLTNGADRIGSASAALSVRSAPICSSC